MYPYHQRKNDTLDYLVPWYLDRGHDLSYIYLFSASTTMWLIFLSNDSKTPFISVIPFYHLFHFIPFYHLFDVIYK